MAEMAGNTPDVLVAGCLEKTSTCALLQVDEMKDPTCHTITVRLF